MAIMMVESIVGVLLLLMLLLILLLILIACKPWRFFLPSSYSSSRSRTVKVDELERPLVLDVADPHDQNNEFTRHYDLEGACYQNEGILRSTTRTQGLVHKQRLPVTSTHPNQGGSVVVDVVPDPAGDVSVGQTLRCPQRSIEVPKHVRQEDQITHLKPVLENVAYQDYIPNVITDQGSCLSLEVISGPSCGLKYSVESTNRSKLPLTLGRVSGDLILNDSEVSGKHAMINWNANKRKWELLDMGSLNGTLLNSQAINHPEIGSRQWGNPVELSSGCIITVGTTSKVYVNVTSKSDNNLPFSVGIASDPMAMRRGGKKLPMEDVCYYQWPIPGIDQFGVFGICDGHGGVAAADAASKLLLGNVASILSDSSTREKVLSQCDASDVLRVVFSQTEASMDNYYEGCTATLLLVWADGHENFVAQCANLGDSACIISVSGEQIKMTEDHRVSSNSERLRISEVGEPLKDGETRLCGLNLARMLGDKFLKQQDARFSTEPYISQPVHINRASSAFALLASDGFWDVVSVRKAHQLALQLREKYSGDGENLATKVADLLLSEARTLRTKDNTSIIFLDFDKKSRMPCRVGS